MKVKPAIWTFDQEDQRKVLQSARYYETVKAAASGDGDRLADDREQVREPNTMMNMLSGTIRPSGG
jgi:hypothetical protein